MERLKMYMSRALGIFLGLLWWVSAVAAETPNLGEELSPQELEELSFTVLPDGQGLPAGSGLAAEGEAVYQRHCLACHGPAGEGGINDPLAGGRGTLNTTRPLRTVGSYWPYATTIFDYIRRAMPYTAPGSLSNDETYAVTAYLLHINDIIGKQERMDARSLPQVEMPNRSGFYWSAEAKAR